MLAGFRFFSAAAYEVGQHMARVSWRGLSVLICLGVPLTYVVGNLLVLHDLVDRHRVGELRVRIPGRVFVVLKHESALAGHTRHL